MRAIDRLSRRTRRHMHEMYPESGLSRLLYVWGPAFAVMIAIFVMSSRSDLGGPDRMVELLQTWAARWPTLAPLFETLNLIHRYESWIGHFIAYALLALAFIWGLGRQWPVNRHNWYLAWSLAVLYGISDEWHQSFVPGRMPDVRDVIMDGLGAAVALTLAYCLLARRRASGQALFMLGSDANTHRSRQK